MAYKVELDSDKVPYVQISSNVQLRLNLEELEELDKERAAVELRESEETVSSAIIAFRKLIKDEKNLMVPIDDDSFLLKFLRPCKYYYESAFKLMRKFYYFKVKYPHIGLNLTPKKIRHVFDEDVLIVLPTRTIEGGRILIINVGTKWNTRTVTVDDMFRSAMVAIEIAMLEPKTQLGGVHVILDMQGLSFTHICQFSPAMAKLITEWVQECTPVRLKGIHVIHQSFIFEMVYSIFKPFLGKKLKKKLFFHGNDKASLCSKVSTCSLPEYLGGTANIPNDIPGYILSEMLTHYEDLFNAFCSYGYVK